MYSWIICAALVAVLAAAFVLISRARRDYSVRVAAVVEGSGGTVASAATAAGTVTVTAAARLRAMAYNDSARACGSDAEAAIRFFRLAIGFNKNNLHAWYGLLDACRAAGRTEEAAAVRQDMEKLFGTAVFSTEMILKSFGTPVEYRREGDGSLYVEYRTKSPNERKKLLAEAYVIARELKNSGACKTFSLFISTNASNGLMVHCGCDAALGSPAEFEAGATVYFFDKPRKP